MLVFQKGCLFCCCCQNKYYCTIIIETLLSIGVGRGLEVGGGGGGGGGEDYACNY